MNKETESEKVYDINDIDEYDYVVDKYLMNLKNSGV